MLFVLGDSLTRTPIELLCSSCGVHSCNLFKQHGAQGCELERGIKIVQYTVKNNRWGGHNEIKLEVKVMKFFKEFLSALYQPVNSDGKTAVDMELTRQNHIEKKNFQFYHGTILTTSITNTRMVEMASDK